MIEIILYILGAFIAVFILLAIGIYIMAMNQIDEFEDDEHYPFT